MLRPARTGRGAGAGEPRWPRSSSRSTLVAITSTAIGLLASALVQTTEQTTPILVVSVMSQLVLSGGLFAIDGPDGLEIISCVDPSRWGFAGARPPPTWSNFPFPDPLWVHVRVQLVEAAASS